MPFLIPSPERNKGKVAVSVASKHVRIPYPKVPLEYLDMISENEGALFLLGVTGQE